MAEEGAKITGIRHIVRLREMLQKWQSIALGPKEEAGTNSPTTAIIPATSRDEKLMIRSSSSACESDDDGGDSSLEPPPDVPKGYLAVYVGPEHRRFVIPTMYLGLPVFKVLLEKAEEEFGFDHQGAITFPCEIETFKYIIKCMERHQKGLIDDEGNPTGEEE